EGASGCAVAFVRSDELAPDPPADRAGIGPVWLYNEVPACRVLPWRGSKEKSCSASRCCRGVMKTGSLPLGGGCGPGRAGVLRWSGWRWPGRKVHSGGGVPPVVTVHAWTVRGRKRVQLPGPPGG